jgi:U3 small nucleolar ribonucleoprotein protein IMP4
MLRRQARQRREFLFQKATEAKEHATHDRKRRVREALEQGKPLPPELREQADEIRAQLELEDDKSRGAPSDGIDSEYANAGVADPKVLVTTSHDPSSKLTQFLKEMKILIPNSHRMNRGGNTVQQIVDTCRADGFTDLIILQEHRGIPDGLVVSHMPHGPTAYFGLQNVVMRHDIPQCAPISEAYPHLVLHNLTTRVGKRVGAILKHLFPVPKPDSRRVVSLINRDDFLSFRHHVYGKDKADIILMEAGPRFELKLYQVKLGTIDQTEVENEYLLRPYQNSAKRRRTLGE